MATTEERLAALEAKMAKLTATTPTTYYEHQYSGEEIDAAVGRALTGGALDTSVTNVSNQLGTFTRPNLLDNWYFGRPVDQRGGYVVPPGMAYKDVNTGVTVGTTTTYYTVTQFSNGNAIITVDGLNRFVQPGGYVRGYTGNGYSVDRWMIGAGSNGTLSLADGGLKLTRTDGLMYLTHRILKTQIPEGSVLTYSVLTTSGLFPTSFVVKNDTYHEQDVGGGISLGWNYTPAEHMELTLVNNTVNSEVTLLAAKLELGSTQTLAHREGDKWVLNEVPDYGEQLRKCQRYCFVWGYSAKQTSCLAVMQAYEPERLFGLIPTPVTMRATPVVTGGSLTTFGGMVTSLWSLNLCGNGIRAVASVNGAKFVVGQAVGIENADDNGRVIFSADL